MPRTAVVTVQRLISANKAISAAVTTLALALATALSTWIADGTVDLTPTRAALGGLVFSVIVGAATWAVSAGKAEIAPQHDQRTEGDPQPQQVVIEPV